MVLVTAKASQVPLHSGIGAMPLHGTSGVTKTTVRDALHSDVPNVPFQPVATHVSVRPFEKSDEQRVQATAEQQVWNRKKVKDHSSSGCTNEFAGVCDPSPARSHISVASSSSSVSIFHRPRKAQLLQQRQQQHLPGASPSLLSSHQQTQQQDPQRLVLTLPRAPKHPQQQQQREHAEHGSSSLTGSSQKFNTIRELRQQKQQQQQQQPPPQVLKQLEDEIRERSKERHHGPPHMITHHGKRENEVQQDAATTTSIAKSTNKPAATATTQQQKDATATATATAISFVDDRAEQLESHLQQLRADREDVEDSLRNILHQRDALLSMLDPAERREIETALKEEKEKEKKKPILDWLEGQQKTKTKKGGASLE